MCDAPRPMVQWPSIYFSYCCVFYYVCCFIIIVLHISFLYVYAMIMLSALSFLLLASCSSYIILHCIMIIMPCFAYLSFAECSCVNPLLFLPPPHFCSMHIPATIHQVHPSLYPIQTSPFSLSFNYFPFSLKTTKWKKISFSFLHFSQKAY